MFKTLMLFAALTIGQGQALHVEIPDEPGLESVTISWNKKTVPFVKRESGWVTILGVDLDRSAGVHEAEVSRTYADGRVERSAQPIEVSGREFRTTRLEVAPKFVQLSPENQERAARERQEISNIYGRITPEALWTEPFAVPIPGATDGRNFGHRRVFNDQPRAPHSGADLTASTGTEILATNRGRVVLAKDLFFSGNAVFVDHGLGIYSVYLHLSAISVEPGDLVERGQVVGLAGATGRVTGPHLHWGVRAQGARVDPFTLLD